MKYKVLVAEDELIERMVLCKILRKHLGELCDIFESKNGREALEIYQREQPRSPFWTSRCRASTVWK